MGFRTKEDNSFSKNKENHNTGVGNRTEKYSDLFKNFDEAFIAVDWDLTIIHWNNAAERVTAIKAKNAIGKKISAVLPEMMAVDFTPYLTLLQQKQRARFMMNAISRETNKPSTFEVSMYPSDQAVIIVVEDKTEEERMKRLSAIGETAGMVGHDIRNPLQAISGDLYLLREYSKSMTESETKKEVVESLDNIESNVNYINKIVADLQDYSRSLKPQFSDFNLYDSVTSILQTLSRQNNLEVSLQLDPKFIVKSDKSMVRRILSNLFVNAIQAMPSGGKLTVSGYNKDDKILISVEDTGMGIPADIKLKLFSPMMTTKARGQGLGLAVVKRLVEALDGSISFESEEGRGTKFIIELRKCN